MTPEELMQMFLLYPNASIKFGNELLRFSGVRFWNKMPPELILETQYGKRYVSFNKVQLVLKDLENIIREDAIHCGSLCGLNPATSEILMSEHLVHVLDDTFRLQISYNGYCCLRKNGVLYNINTIPVHNFLRLKNYCIDPDLFTLKIAVKK